MEPSAAFSVILLVAVIAAPGVIAAARAENPPPEEPDYKPDAQLHALFRKLQELDEALMDLLALELPRGPQVRSALRDVDSLDALRAHEDARARAADLLKQAETAARRLPSEAPQQAHEIITLALAEADSALYSQGLAADASRALVRQNEAGEVDAPRALHALEHALVQSTHSWHRAHEETFELGTLLDPDAVTPPPFPAASYH